MRLTEMALPKFVTLKTETFPEILMHPRVLVIEPPIVNDPRTLAAEPSLVESQALTVEPAVAPAVIDADDPKRKVSPTEYSPQSTPNA